MARIVKVPTSTTSPRPYEVRWSWYDATGKRRYKKERFATLSNAKAKKREVEDAVASASLPDYSAGKQAVSHWAALWFKSKRPLVKVSTYNSYIAIWNSSVEPRWGTARVNAITTADVQEWVAELLEDGKKPPTIKHHVWLLGQIIAGAARARAVAHNPVRDVQLPTDRAVGRTPYSPRFLTAEQVESIAAELSEPTHAALVRFMAWTGLRTGEVSGLNVGDVDLLRNTVTVRRTAYRTKGSEWREDTPKSGKVREVPLMPWVADDLRDLLAIHPTSDPDAPLWPGTRAGGGERDPKTGRLVTSRSGSLDFTRRWEPTTFRRNRFKPAVCGAGVAGNVRLHDLRHTYASLCASEGIPSAQVASWMGHASDVITRVIYTHLFDNDTTKHAGRLAARGRPSTPAPAREATVTDLHALRA